jgi:hypothetical protein
MIHTHLPSGSEKVSLGELASGLSLSLSLSLFALEEQQLAAGLCFLF